MNLKKSKNYFSMPSFVDEFEEKNQGSPHMLDWTPVIITIHPQMTKNIELPKKVDFFRNTSKDTVLNF